MTLHMYSLESSFMLVSQKRGQLRGDRQLDHKLHTRFPISQTAKKHIVHKGEHQTLYIHSHLSMHWWCQLRMSYFWHEALCLVNLDVKFATNTLHFKQEDNVSLQQVHCRLHGLGRASRAGKLNRNSIFILDHTRHQLMYVVCMSKNAADKIVRGPDHAGELTFRLPIAIGKTCSCGCSLHSK